MIRIERVSVSLSVSLSVSTTAKFSNRSFSPWTAAWASLSRSV